jgi:hypothetical protein
MLKRIIILLNTRYYKVAMGIFVITIIAHLMEHFTQTGQVYICGWDRVDAKGMLGLAYPRLMEAEWFHFSYACEMLLGLLLFKMSFGNKAAFWWKVTIGVQVWHLFEHSLLLFQDLTGKYLLNGMYPSSILQLVFPRIELHLFYNLLVLAPMIVAMYYKYFDKKLKMTIMGGGPIEDSSRY